MVSVLTKWDIRLSPMINIRSSGRFNIYTGIDQNHDLSFTDRPSFAQPGDHGRHPYAIWRLQSEPAAGRSDHPAQLRPGAGNGPGQSERLEEPSASGPPHPPTARATISRGRIIAAIGLAIAAAVVAAARAVVVALAAAVLVAPAVAAFSAADTRHKYNLTIGVTMQNILNHTNLVNFSGNLTSPFFGIANQAMNGRAIEAQLRFGF